MGKKKTLFCYGVKTILSKFLCPKINLESLYYCPPPLSFFLMKIVNQKKNEFTQALAYPYNSFYKVVITIVSYKMNKGEDFHSHV